MATTKNAPTRAERKAALLAAGKRQCIGSERYGIKPHDAPVDDFPVQPSQKDGLGRMCKTHWNQYTAGLARDAKARKAAESGAVDEASVPTADGTVAAPKAKAPRARKGGPIGYLGSEPGGPVEVLPGGTKRRFAPTPKGTREIAPANDGGGQSPD